MEAVNIKEKSNKNYTNQKVEGAKAKQAIREESIKFDKMASGSIEFSKSYNCNGEPTSFALKVCENPRGSNSSVINTVSGSCTSFSALVAGDVLSGKNYHKWKIDNSPICSVCNVNSEIYCFIEFWYDPSKEERVYRVLKQGDVIGKGGKGYHPEVYSQYHFDNVLFSELVNIAARRRS